MEATWELTDLSRALATEDFSLRTPMEQQKLLKVIILQQRELTKFAQIARQRQYHLYSRSGPPSGYTEEMERYYQNNHRYLENVDRQNLGQRRYLLEFLLSTRQKTIIPVSDNSEKWLQRQAELLGLSTEVVANDKLPLMLRFFCPYCKDFSRPRGWPHNLGCEWCFEGKQVHKERGGYYHKHRGRNWHRLEIRQKCLLIRKHNIEALKVKESSE